LVRKGDSLPKTEAPIADESSTRGGYLRCRLLSACRALVSPVMSASFFAWLQRFSWCVCYSVH